jgi:positive regulator of sigma E activity
MYYGLDLITLLTLITLITLIIVLIIASIIFARQEVVVRVILVVSWLAICTAVHHHAHLADAARWAKGLCPHARALPVGSALS